MFNENLDSMERAMAEDAFNNEHYFESTRVAIWDVSDCPDLNVKIDEDSFTMVEDIFLDIEHESLMEEAAKYA